MLKDFVTGWRLAFLAPCLVLRGGLVFHIANNTGRLVRRFVV